MQDCVIEALSSTAGHKLAGLGWMLVTAESCTGGWLAQAITDIAGSSGWFERGYITYGNAAKSELLDVSETTLEQCGAVSEATVREMAQGALRHSHAQVGIAISGVAGPAGGTAEKPVGTVCLAWADTAGGLASVTECYAGDRRSVRRQAVIAALRGLLTFLDIPAG